MVACQQTRAIFVVVFQLLCFQISLTAECNYVISSDSESGWFTSPNHPKSYPSEANCSWLIHTINPIIISFTHFHTEPKYDLLKIYDGPTTLSPLLLEVSSSSLPPSVVSTTNQILITFTSDRFYSFSGFNATYSSYRCQHFLSSESGSFSFPTYPLNSLDETNCRWLIQTKRRKTFAFTQFHLENDKDWLMIYDGPTESSEILFKGSSNKKIPSLIETTTNQALVVFSSDKFGLHSGFNATYEPLRCQFILSSDSGWLKSPELSIHYPAANCSWLINATQPISLSFTQFEMENSNDWVKVYDGSSTAVELFSSSIYENTQSFIISSTNQMLITFTSEASTSYSAGFIASYKPSRCQELLSDSGWFASPNYPLNYPENSRNCWVIKATYPIMLSFISFHLEEYQDWLTVYDGLSNSRSLLHTSLYTLMDYSITSKTNQMLVTFTSDGSGSFSGFNATYEPYRCHQILSSESGWFTLKDGPFDYAPKFNCTWLINATRPIILAFNVFIDSVKEERLTFYDGPSTSSALLLNSSLTNPFLVTSTTNQMLVVFNSSLSESNSQFNATYYASECQHYLNSESGWFSSPKHSLNYTGDNSCRWYFDTQKPIIFTFHQFLLENDKDWLMIYDGPTDSSDLLFKGSSKEEIPSFIETTTNLALVVFSSDKSGPYSGFNATYEPLVCQFILSSESGLVKSPKLSIHYPVTNCSWSINSTQPISLWFTQFEMKSSNDSVKIYDGSSTAVELFDSSGDQNIPSLIMSSTNQMLITFTSKEPTKSGSYSKFIASYEPSRCQEILSDSGWFTSPNYPLNYPENSKNCWVIKATYPIMISFISFHLKKYQDWLTIYNGPSTAVEFLKLSSYHANIELIIPGTNKILITFSSGESNSFSGFNATFSPSRCQEISSPYSGWFTTPNYPSNYSDNLRLCWSINATQPIKLSFNHFNLEENRDVLRVYDGLSTSRPLLETYIDDIYYFWRKGLETPFHSVRSRLDSGLSVRRFDAVANPSNYSIISNTNQMLVTFTSDGSGSFSGFNATYEPYRCHQILSSESGWFTLKDGPFDYAPKFNCSWLINATRPIILTFNEFIDSVKEERLTFYDGPSTSSALLLNSSLTDPFIVTSTTNQMLVVFNSSLSESNSQFNATYYASECQHYLSSESGWFSSPKYPLNYTGDNSCRWYFDTQKPIIFTFHQLLLENDRDGLMIYDGLTESSKILFKGSSNNQIPSSIKTTNNKALVVFSSDKSGPSGFNATYEPFRCEYILSSESGWFRSPEFLKSNRVINSNWIINTTQPIIFSVLYLQLNHESDFFMIYDGPTNTSAQLFRGPGFVDSPIVSTTYPILVIFTSALTFETTGFSATYSQCHVLLKNSGWITYPEKYPNNAICCWLIQTTVPLKFSTNYFITEANRDWLKIYDGPSQSSELLKSASGYDHFSVTSTASRILVTFTSYIPFFGTYPRFNLTYSAN